VIEAGTPPSPRSIVHYGVDAVPVNLKPAAGVEAPYAPRRTVLDPILVDAAEEAAAEFCFGVSMSDLLRNEAGRVVGIQGRNQSGRKFEARSPLTVGADGMRSTVARKVEAGTYRNGSSSSALVYGYWSDVEIEAYEWFFRPGLSGGLIPTNNGEVCVWAGAPSHRFRTELLVDGVPAIERVFSKLDRTAARRIAGGRRRGVRAFSGARGFFRQAWGPGWALVGDAGYFKDPLSAHGISDALRDAELLGRATAGVLSGESSEVAAFGAYQRVRDELSKRLFTATDAVASYRWSLTELFDLLVEISAAMRVEFATLASMDEPTLVAA
jgi:flavin-dependent dehydrogenase